MFLTSVYLKRYPTVYPIRMGLRIQISWKYFHKRTSLSSQHTDHSIQYTAWSSQRVINITLFNFVVSLMVHIVDPNGWIYLDVMWKFLDMCTTKCGIWRCVSFVNSTSFVSLLYYLRRTMNIELSVGMNFHFWFCTPNCLFIYHSDMFGNIFKFTTKSTELLKKTLSFATFVVVFYFVLTHMSLVTLEITHNSSTSFLTASSNSKSWTENIKRNKIAHVKKIIIGISRRDEKSNCNTYYFIRYQVKATIFFFISPFFSLMCHDHELKTTTQRKKNVEILVWCAWMCYM